MKTVDKQFERGHLASYARRTDVFEYLLLPVPSATLSSYSHTIGATLRNKRRFPRLSNPEAEAWSEEVTGPCPTGIKGQRQDDKTGLDFNVGRMNFDHQGM